MIDIERFTDALNEANDYLKQHYPDNLIIGIQERNGMPWIQLEFFNMNLSLKSIIDLGFGNKENYIQFLIKKKNFIIHCLEERL